MRTVSVGISRVFRLSEVKDGNYRIEQAAKDSLTNSWQWHPLAFCNNWNEAHGFLHKVQAEWLDKMQVRQGGSFNVGQVKT